MSRPGRLLLAGLLLPSAQAALAADAWVAARSPHFLVVSNGGEGGARRVVHQFEQLRGLFVTNLKTDLDSGRPFVILAVRDEDSLREVAPGFWERKGGAIPAGIFSRGSDRDYVLLRLDVADREGGYQVIYHEYAHFVTGLSFRALPTWLSEGLAEFYGASEVREHTVRWGRMQGDHLRLMRGQPQLPLSQLLAADRSSPLYNERNRVSMFYAQSAVLTHYLLLGNPERGRQVSELIALLQEGVPVEEAQRRVLGDVGRLETELDKYAHRVQYPAMETDVTLETQAVQVAPLPRAEADAIRADYLSRSGRTREARRMLEPALAEAPESSAVHESLGLVALREGRQDEAARELARAVELQPRNYVALYHASTLRAPEAQAADDRARRERALRRVIEINPRFAPAHIQLAKVLLEGEGNAEEALGLARRAWQLDPPAATYRLVELQALKRLGRAEEAGRVETALLQATRSDPAVLLAIVRDHEENGRTDEAEAALRRAHEGNPQSIEIALLLGRFLRQRKRFDDAETVLRDALRQQPESPFLQNNLAYLLADSGTKAAEALKLVDKALKREPQNPAYLDTRGWALFRLKRLPEAEQTLRQALQTRPDPDAQDHLGDVLLARGNRAGALEQWREALGSSQWSVEQRTALESKVRAAGAPAASPSPP
jgi:tetratricopeptide (TPR) repeat protein